ERAQINALAKAATKLEWAGVRTIEARAHYNPIIENLPRVGTLGVLVYGGWLVIQGDITEGTLFAFATYVLLLQAPFRTLGLFLMFGQRARASAARIYEVLDEKPDIVDRPDAVDLIDPRGEIIFDDVSFRYASTSGEDEDDNADANLVLDRFTLRLEAGETVALVGRTGSGKSTVARLLGRFYDVTGGAVRIDGHDVRDLTQASLRHAVGTVSDDPFLFSATLADNIAYARPDADRADVIAAAKAARAHEFITSLPGGYDEVVGERGYTLSGGQRQRVALARALLANPKILVLDDATSAIDVHVEELIHQALKEQLTDRTTLVIAQRLSTIALADRVALVQDGRVAVTGTHRELLRTEPAYAEILANLATELDTDPGSEAGADFEAVPGGGS
ncbi:MAG: ABC transporter ATP-binding protein, partial [Acidimicrobiales bacterium]